MWPVVRTVLCQDLRDALGPTTTASTFSRMGRDFQRCFFSRRIEPGASSDYLRLPFTKRTQDGVSVRFQKRCMTDSKALSKIGIRTLPVSRIVRPQRHIIDCFPQTAMRVV